MPKHYKFAFAGSAKIPHWKQVVVEYDALIEQLSQHPEREAKDGPAFVPGELIGGERKKDTVEELNMFVFDVDGFQTFDEICEIIKATGHFGIVTTTYSHGVEQTDIPSRAFQNHARRQKWNIRDGVTLEQVTKYLEDHDKGHLTNVKIVDDNHKEPEGYYIRITHDPVDKMRIVLPMKEPFIFADISYDRLEAAEYWSNLYLAVGEKLGLRFDTSCQDPSRLYYLPAHSPDSEFKYELIGDKDAEEDLIDWKDYKHLVDEQAKKQKARKQQRRQELSNNIPSIVTDRDGREFNLINWYQKNRSTFSIVEAFERFAPDDITTPTSRGGYHITCPNEAEHSKPGGKGTYCADPDEQENSGRFVIGCQHHHCLDLSTLDFLYMLISNGTFTLAELETCSEGDPFDAVVDQINAVTTSIDEAQRRAAPAPEETETHSASAIQKRAALASQSGKEQHSSDRDFGPEVYDAADVASGAKFVNQIKQAVVGVATDVTIEEEIFIVAHSNLDMEGLGEYYTLRKDRISDVTKREFLGQIFAKREELWPIDQKIRKIIRKHASMTDNSDQLQTIRLFYNLTMPEITKLFQEIYSSIHGAYVHPDLQEALKSYKKYAKILITGDVQFIDVDESRKQGTPLLYKKSGLLTAQQAHHVTVPNEDGNQERVGVCKYWMDNVTDVPFYTGVDFDPSMTTKKFNLFYGFTNIEPEEGDWSMIWEHILHIWCKGDEKLANWVMTYFAHIFQYPANRPPAAIALIGGQGTGKSLPLEYGLARMLNPYFRQTHDKKDMVGQFNPVLYATLLVLAEETLFKGDKVTMDALKAIISGQQVRTEQKFRDMENREIHSRFIFTSNHEHALGLEPDDRRFLVLSISEERKGDTDYFTEMKQRLYGENGYPDMSAAWLHALLHWDPEKVGLTWSDLNRPPLTDMKMRQISYSRSPEQQFYYDILLNGKVTNVDERYLEEGNLFWPYDEEETLIETEKLKACFRDYMAYMMPSQKAYHINGYQSAFQEIFGVKIGSISKAQRVGKVSRRHTALPNRKDTLKKLMESGRITKEEFDSARQLYEMEEEIQDEQRDDTDADIGTEPTL